MISDSKYNFCRENLATSPKKERRRLFPSENVLFPMSVLIVPKNRLMVYFESKEERLACYTSILRKQGFKNAPIDQYQLKEHGTYNSDSALLFGQHVLSGKKVVIKVIGKPRTGEDALA